MVLPKSLITIYLQSLLANFFSFFITFVLTMYPIRGAIIPYLSVLGVLVFDQILQNTKVVQTYLLLKKAHKEFGIRFGNLEFFELSA